jgi:hypothetical protein
MAILPDNQNPLAHDTLYDKLGIDAFANEAEMATQLEAITIELEQLPDGPEKNERMGAFQAGIKLLKSRLHRLQINSLIIDKASAAAITTQLDRLKNLGDSELGMPAADLSLVLMEGSITETAAMDFDEIKTDPSLEFNPDEYKNFLSGQSEASQVIFDS